jgi:hypothetical protein
MSSEQTDEKEINNFIIQCPHCNEPIIIEQLNCRIFRHGSLKCNGKQIDPHSSKELCDFYVLNNKIYGCGKPFMINGDIHNFTVSICDYI